MDDTLGTFAKLGWPAIASLVAIIMIIIILTLVRKVSSQSKGSAKFDQAGLNLVDLKKKGLLTPEELAAVGNSMVRQMEKVEATNRRKSNAPATDTLLLDPEVRRLETLAAIGKKIEPAVNSTTVADSRPSASSPSSANPLFPTTQPKSFDYTQDEIDALELPLDIQQMVDAGLLMPDEVDKVKRRILDRQKAETSEQ